MGIDPGTKTGLCALDFYGNVLLLTSRKNFSAKEIIKTIMSVGHPSIVATDRARPPALVSKIATSFGAPVHSPETDATRRSKEESTSSYATHNLHERDALAAALIARNAYKDVFERVNRRSSGEENEELKDLLLKRRVHNITEALRGQGHD